MGHFCVQVFRKKIKRDRSKAEAHRKEGEGEGEDEEESSEEDSESDFRYGERSAFLLHAHVRTYMYIVQKLQQKLCLITFIHVYDM